MFDNIGSVFLSRLIAVPTFHYLSEPGFPCLLVLVKYVGQLKYRLYRIVVCLICSQENFTHDRLCPQYEDEIFSTRQQRLFHSWESRI